MKPNDANGLRPASERPLRVLIINDQIADFAPDNQNLQIRAP